MLNCNTVLHEKFNCAGVGYFLEHIDESFRAGKDHRPQTIHYKNNNKWTGPLGPATHHSETSEHPQWRKDERTVAAAASRAAAEALVS